MLQLKTIITKLTTYHLENNHKNAETQISQSKLLDEDSLS
jgi:hypothetical protein